MLAGRAAVVQVNTDASPAVSARFKVTGVPVLILLHQGRVVDQLPGARPAEDIVNWFRSREKG